MRMRKRKSIGFKIILSFLLTSIVPIILINLLSYYNTSQIVKENINDLTINNLNQIESSLDVSIDSYEDILYQIYSDDDIVNLVNKINNKEDLALSKSQLRRALRGFFYVKEYIKSISIITEDGTMVFYDSITGSTTQDSWSSSLGMSRSELYQKISDTRESCIIPTAKVDKFANMDNYLFHIGHSVVDFKKQNKQIGIVVLSIDEKMLQEICSGGKADSNATNFIVASSGEVVSYMDRNQVGKQMAENKKGRQEKYTEFVQENHIFDGKEFSLNYVHDDKLNWDIVNATNQDETMGRLWKQQKILVITLIVSLTVLFLIIVLLTRGLTGSIKSVVQVMKSVGEGRTEARVQLSNKMSSEIETIAQQYNSTMDKLMDSVEKEKELDLQRKDAEIKALEAQINPHFLYNTLDTINWIAIGKKEFEISRAITALAVILRYGIDNSNAIVTIREEYEWLKQYLLLQQIRLKEEFESKVLIQPEALDAPIHKLLMQPFVENSIIHGFDGVTRKHILEISISINQDGGLEIEIYDNGKGIPQEIVDNINNGRFGKTQEKNHIGMENAYNRIKMYYGDRTKIKIESVEGAYTRVKIVIPEMAGENS